MRYNYFFTFNYLQILQSNRQNSIIFQISSINLFYLEYIGENTIVIESRFNNSIVQHFLFLKKSFHAFQLNY
jgi:hypothetical protein